MARKKASGEWGPFYETYIKKDREGNVFEQEVPVYLEVTTPYGTFGVPKRHKLTFEVKDDETVPVFTEVKSAKPRKAKKVADAPVEEPVEQE